MPYIKKEDREKFNTLLEFPFSELSAGELNYLITMILKHTYPKGYADYNALVGVLESVKLELYRKVIAPYEDIKIKENGDV